MKKKTKQIKIGSVSIGGNNPIAIQTMANTKTFQVKETIDQIKGFEQAGVDIVRISIPDKKSVDALRKIKKAVNVPIVADIHFKGNLALDAIKAGADKIRLNPGTIRNKEKIVEIIKACKARKIPIRIGVNSGSLSENFEHLRENDLAEALVESALDFISLFEKEGFFDIVLSVKASSVLETIKAYQVLSSKTQYPLHIGLTEAGPLVSGTAKSAVALGILLNQGIGDTIRVSLTAEPIEEIKIAYKILGALEIRKRGVDIISCPSCSRCEVNVIKLAETVEKKLSNITIPLKVAVMGCAVNGPGEAKDADVGIASGTENGLLFVKGKIIGKFPEEQLVSLLLKEVKNLVKMKGDGPRV